MSVNIFKNTELNEKIKSVITARLQRYDDGKSEVDFHNNNLVVQIATDKVTGMTRHSLRITEKGDIIINLTSGASESLEDMQKITNIYEEVTEIIDEVKESFGITDKDMDDCDIETVSELDK